MRLYALKVNVCLIILHELKMIIEQSYIVNQHFHLTFKVYWLMSYAS